jgi:hypothetical protein
MHIQILNDHKFFPITQKHTHFFNEISCEGIEPQLYEKHLPNVTHLVLTPTTPY